MKIWRLSWEKWCGRYFVNCVKIVHPDISIPELIAGVLIQASVVKNMPTLHNARVSYMSEGLFSQVRAQMLRYAKELMSI